MHSLHLHQFQQKLCFYNNTDFFDLLNNQTHIQVKANQYPNYFFLLFSSCIFIKIVIKKSVSQYSDTDFNFQIIKF